MASALALPTPPALHAALRPERPSVAPGPHATPVLSLAHPVASEITPFSVARSAPPLSRLGSVSLPPIMTALSRSAATALSAHPAAARGPRLSVARRNPVSSAPLWGSCGMRALLHAAVAAMMASAAFSVASAQGWSTARLSRMRYSLSATSVGTVAIFAGGVSSELTRIVFVCCVRDF